MTLDEVLSLWEVDAVIDTKRLDETGARTPLLHAKYLSLFSKARLILKKRLMDMDALRKQKWLWFNGKMTKTEMDSLGWSYDPFNGLKILKSDMEMWYANDPDIKKLHSQIEYQKELVDALKEILDNIKWRHQTIKNMIDWRRFEAGN